MFSFGYGRCGTRREPELEAVNAGSTGPAVAAVRTDTMPRGHALERLVGPGRTIVLPSDAATGWVCPADAEPVVAVRRSPIKVARRRWPSRIMQVGREIRCRRSRPAAAAPVAGEGARR